MTGLTRIFAYGTLMRGMGNHRFVDSARFLGACRTVKRYTLLSLGEFPGMTEGGCTAVIGELYAVDDATLAALDRLEGVPTFYRRVVVALAGRRPAQAYVLPSGSAQSFPIIVTGDWRRFRCGSG